MSVRSRTSEAGPRPQAGTAGVRLDDDPYALIDMLLVAALDRLSEARASLLSGDYRAKQHYLSSALSIIGHLRGVVDAGAEGGFAANLRSLYDHMLRRLPAANRIDDVAPVDDALSLLRAIKSAWDSLPAADIRH